MKAQIAADPSKAKRGLGVVGQSMALPTEKTRASARVGVKKVVSTSDYRTNFATTVSNTAKSRGKGALRYTSSVPAAAHSGAFLTK